MKPSEILDLAIDALDRLGIEYFITGSFASTTYGEARTTNDVDIVIRLTPEQARQLCREFPAVEFYVSEDAAVEAAKRAGPFNVIHSFSGFKIDFMVAPDTEFDRSRFSRRRSFTVESGRPARFSAPEDVILKKLEFYREGGSDKHLRDIRGILKTLGDKVDREYIERWVARLGVAEQWQSAITGVL